jgi:hypothetical protein
VGKTALAGSRAADAVVPADRLAAASCRLPDSNLLQCCHTLSPGAGNPSDLRQLCFFCRYVGNRTGTTGAALAIGTGIWTFSRHRPGSVMDVVPGDAVSSTILLAAAAAVQVRQNPGPGLSGGLTSYITSSWARVKPYSLGSPGPCNVDKPA